MSLFLHGNVADVSDSGDDDGDDFFNYEEFSATPFINKQKVWSIHSLNTASGHFIELYFIDKGEYTALYMTKNGV